LGRLNAQLEAEKGGPITVNAYGVNKTLQDGLIQGIDESFVLDDVPI